MKSPHGRRLIPSWKALVAFEAAARLGNFTRAAQELNLTQSSISAQVKMLERRLGVTLFERVAQRVVITEVGTYYAGEIRQTLERFAAATTQAISFRTAGGVLQLSLLPTFGTKWLIPRLPDFFAQNRGITINFSSHVRQVDFQREVVDAAIHFGDSEWPGVIMHRLVTEEVVPVATPALIKREKIRVPEDLQRTMLLLQSTRLDAWTQWFADVGLPKLDASTPLVFEQFGMVLQAAIAGLGVALLPRILVTDELAQGEVVELFNHPLLDTKAYYLAYPKERANYRPLVLFRDWLLRKIRS